MLNSNLERARLVSAQNIATEFIDEYQHSEKPLQQEVDALGSMVMANGLLQALVMKAANPPQGDTRQAAAVRVSEELCQWLKDKDPAKSVLSTISIEPPQQNTSALNWVFARLMKIEGISDYQLVELEAIAWLEQFKLIAKMKKSQAENNAPAPAREQNNAA